MAYSLRLGYNANRIDVMIDLIMLLLLVVTAALLIVLGVTKDRKIKKEVKLMVEAGKNYIRCSRCTKWTELSVSSMFKDMGVFCASCSKIVLLEPSFTAPIIQPAKKSSGFMSFIKGNQDEY